MGKGKREKGRKKEEARRKREMGRKRGKEGISKREEE